MPFHEIRFPEKINYMFSGGPVFKTTVQKSASGKEQRVIQWTAPIREWKAASGPKDATDIRTLYEFFLARLGRGYGFRWKDWNDYKAINQAIPNDGSGVLQLQVIYPDAINPTTRPIIKPRNEVSETKSYVGITVIDTTAGATLVEGTDFTVDYTTGFISFIGGGGHRAGHTLQWSGEYDCPVRFQNDAMQYSRDSFTEFNWSDLSIIELRQGN